MSMEVSRVFFCKPKISMHNRIGYRKLDTDKSFSCNKIQFLNGNKRLKSNFISKKSVLSTLAYVNILYKKNSLYGNVIINQYSNISTAIIYVTIILSVPTMLGAIDM